LKWTVLPQAKAKRKYMKEVSFPSLVLETALSGLNSVFFNCFLKGIKTREIAINANYKLSKNLLL
jgi:hypothetical protein